MTAYVDTSALLRYVLREPDALDDLPSFDTLVASELLETECRRTLDRLRVLGRLTLDDSSAALTLVGRWVDAIDVVLLKPEVLRRAGDPLPSALGTLDAIHLASALAWRDQQGPVDVVLTHDSELARAARAFDFQVRGA